jgi:hypothetical protein
MILIDQVETVDSKHNETAANTREIKQKSPVTSSRTQSRGAPAQ